jgi:HEAT repeat protein
MKSNLLTSLLLLVFAAAPLTVAADSASATLENLRHYESGADATPLRHYEQLVAQSVNDDARRKAVEADLVSVLAGDSTFEAKRFACVNLATIGSGAAVPGLAALLSEEPTVGIACAALAQIPAASASAALRQALNTTTDRAQAQVAHALGVRKDAAAVNQLARLARANDPMVAEAAIIALGEVASPEARRIIATFRHQPSPVLNRAVAAASLELAADLAAQGQTQAATGIYRDLLAATWPKDVRRGALLGWLRLDHDRGERRIIAALQGNDAVLKPAAIAAMSGIQGTNASQRFAAELPKLPPTERALLIEALAERHDPVAQKSVVQQMASQDAAVRLTTIAALGRNGDATTVPVLARALVGADAEETQAIERALVALPGADATDRALIAQLDNRMAGPRTPILSALVRRGSPLAVPAILAETASAEPATARVAFQGLGRLAGANEAEAAINALASLRSADARAEAETAVAQVLARVANPARRSTLVLAALGQAGQADARGSLLRLLPACGDADALASVKAALAEGDPAVREAATRALADWPDLAAWNQLMVFYRQTDSEPHRVLALRGLVRLATEENPHADAALVERYGQLLAGAKSDDDRKLVLGALGGAVQPEALKLAVEMLANDGVRAEATLAVRKLAEALKVAHPEAAAEALKAIERR